MLYTAAAVACKIHLVAKPSVSEWRPWVEPRRRTWNLWIFVRFSRLKTAAHVPQ